MSDLETVKSLLDTAINPGYYGGSAAQRARDTLIMMAPGLSPVAANYVSNKCTDVIGNEGFYGGKAADNAQAILIALTNIRGF